MDDIILMVPKSEFDAYKSLKLDETETYAKCLELRLPKLLANEMYEVIDSYKIDETRCFVIRITQKPHKPIPYANLSDIKLV